LICENFQATIFNFDEMSKTIDSLCLKEGDTVTVTGKVVHTDGFYNVAVKVESAADICVKQRLFRYRDMVICKGVVYPYQYLGVGQITDADDQTCEVEFLSGKTERLYFSQLQRATVEDVAAAREEIEQANLEAEQAKAFQRYMQSMSKEQVLDAIKLMQALPVMK
jgi:hypothetical protein